MMKGSEAEKIKAEMVTARDRLLEIVRHGPEGYTLQRSEDPTLKTYARRSGNACHFMFQATTPVDKEVMLRCLSDSHYVSLWDTNLESIQETEIEPGLVKRIMSYRGSLSPDGYNLTVGGMFGKDPQDESALYWATRSLIPKDQIFPEILEIDASGTYLKSLPSGETLVTVIYGGNVNTSLTDETVAEHAKEAEMWTRAFLRSGTMGGQEKDSSSFEIPNRGSMGENFHTRSFLQSIDFDGTSLPKLPSFSQLSLPFVSQGSLPKPPKTIDVVLPPGRTLKDYWKAIFDNASPVIVFSSDLGKIEYANLSFQILLGVQPDVTETAPTALFPKGDMQLLQLQVNALVSQQISFFAHLATFSPKNGSSAGIVVAETNCSGCFTNEGWFVVMECRALFSKRMGVLAVKNSLAESLKFSSFFATSPAPAAIIAPSGIVIAANTALCNFANVDTLKTTVVGEPIANLLSLHPKIMEEVDSIMARLISAWFQSDPKSYVLDNDFGTVSALAFPRGTNLNRDSLKCVLVTLFGAQALQQKKRRMSVSH